MIHFTVLGWNQPMMWWWPVEEDDSRICRRHKETDDNQTLLYRYNNEALMSQGSL